MSEDKKFNVKTISSNIWKFIKSLKDIFWNCMPYLLSIFGLGLLIVAGFMPFKVKEYYETKIDNYQTIADLGAVGDFIGGTTVAFLTAASTVFF